MTIEVTGGNGAVFKTLLANDLNINALRTNATLRHEEWKLIDTRVIEAAQQRLRGIRDLMTAGLTFNLENPLGTMAVQWETQSDIEPAQRSMDALTHARRDRPEWTTNNVPVYITHKEFEFGIRALEASRKLGQPLDTTTAELAGRKVAESLESALFQGPGVTANAMTAYGYTDHPNRNTKTITDWGLAGTTGTTILTEVLEMVGQLKDDRMYGPYILYISNDFEQKMEEDFKTESDKSIRQRLLEISGLQDIRVSDWMPANSAVLVQLTRDVVDLIDGFQPRVIEWESRGGMNLHFMVMSIMVPRVRSDYDGRSGLVHASV